jgi:hypothetical protein
MEEVSVRQLLVVAPFLALLFGCASPDSARDPGSSTRAPGATTSAGDEVPPLDPAKVPADLRDLVPLAQRWGIGDDVIRAERVKQATDAERAQLRSAFGPKQTRVTAWLNSFGQGPMPEEAAAFMYTQLAIEEMP